MDVQMDFCYKVTLTGLASKMECGLGMLQIANIMIVQPQKFKVKCKLKPLFTAVNGEPI